MFDQSKKRMSLRAYIFAPVRVQFPTSRALRKRIRSSLHHNIPTLFNIALVLSIVASPFTQPSMAAAPTPTHASLPIMAYPPTANCASGDVFCTKQASANLNSASAGNADDGDDTTAWAASSTYAAPWWQVDLQSEKVITKIHILQDSSTGSGYATALTISAFSDNGAEVALTTTGGLTGGAADITFPNTVAYRYYRVNTAAVDHFTAVITFFTVQGFLGAQPARPAVMDIFRNRPSGSSGTISSVYANDANDSTSWSDRDVGNAMFWHVDLGTPKAVSFVRVYQHPSYAPSSNTGYAKQMAVSGCNGTSTYCSNHFNYTTLTTTANSLTGGWITIPVPHSTAYQWYQIDGGQLSNGFGSTWAVFTIQGFIDKPDPLEGSSSFRTKTTCDTCNPVNTASGNFWHSFNDIAIPGRGFPLVLNHSYNAFLSNQNGPMGYGWSHSYNWYISQDPSTNNYIVHEGNGSITPFNPDYSSPLRVHATLTSTNSMLALTSTNGLDTFVFKPLDGSAVAGKLDHMTDRNGYTTSLVYTGTNGLLKTVTDPAGRTLTFAYTADTSSGLLQSVYDNGHTLTTTFAYDGNNNLTSAKDVGAQQTSFTYESVSGYHRLLTMQYPNTGTITNVYDSANRVISHTDPMTRTTQFGYYDFGNGTTTTTMTNPLGLVTVHYYSDNILNQVVQNPGAGTPPGSQEAVTIYDYPPGSTSVSTVTDPLNNTSTYTSDDKGNILSATDPLTRTTTFSYTAASDLAVITHTNGLTTTFDYDTNGNLLKISQPYTETNQIISSTFAYDPLKPGDLLTVTNQLGNKWKYGYDTYGYPMTATNPLTETARFTYDPLGRLKTTASPRVLTTTMAYNLYGDLTSVTDPLGSSSTYQYYPNRTLRWLTSPIGRTTSYYYDLDNEPISVTVPGGVTNFYGYDNAGRTISQANNLGQTTRYSFDDINRVITTTDPLTRSTQLSLDLAGNPAVFTDTMTRTATLSYDNSYQLLGLTYSSCITCNVSYKYDPLGRRTSMTDSLGVSLYSYDSLNRPITVRDGLSQTITYTYDLGSRLTGITYPYNGSSVRTVTRGYNNANRLTSVQDWLNNTTQFGYDPDGDLTAINYPNGVTSTIGYDNADQLISMSHVITSTPFLSFTYTRDKVGQLATSDEGTALGAHGYVYDPYRLMGEAITATTNVSNSWTLDAATQIKSTKSSPTGSSATTTNRTYDNANGLSSWLENLGATSTKNITFTYDLTGNRTIQRDSISSQTGNRTIQRDSISSQTTNYTYNQLNQLTDYNGVAQYKYGGNGLRMQKVQGGSTQNFAWDVAAGLPLLLQDGMASFIYGPGGMPLEEVTNAGSAYYYQTDQLGSIHALTDGGGTVANSYNYDAYGKVNSSTGTVYNPFGYAREYTDAESGFVYLRARYYDPSTQQFLSVDPLVGITGQAYNYVGGSPLNFTDPTGLRKLGAGPITPVQMPDGWWAWPGQGVSYCSDPNTCDIIPVGGPGGMPCTWGAIEYGVCHGVAAPYIGDASAIGLGGLASTLIGRGPASSANGAGGGGGRISSPTSQWVCPEAGGVPGTRAAGASELRSWAQSQGMTQRSNAPPGWEIWEYPSGDWGLKLKQPSPNTPGSNMDRYAAKDANLNYYDPITGASGTRSRVGHLPLDWNK